LSRGVAHCDAQESFLYTSRNQLREAPPKRMGWWITSSSRKRKLSDFGSKQGKSLLISSTNRRGKQ